MRGEKKRCEDREKRENGEGRGGERKKAEYNKLGHRG